MATSYLKLGEGEKKRPGTAGGEAGTGSGTNVQDWNQMECRLQFLQAELEECQAALSRKHLQQQAIVDRAEAAGECSRLRTGTGSASNLSEDGLLAESDFRGQRV